MLEFTFEMVIALPQAVGLASNKSMDDMRGKEMLRFHRILLASKQFRRSNAAALHIENEAELVYAEVECDEFSIVGLPY